MMASQVPGYLDHQDKKIFPHQRVKEIGIRKVLGASVPTILRLLSTEEPCLQDVSDGALLVS